MDFREKTAVITGGTAGIGRCIAEEFRKNGARVAVIDIDGDGAGFDLFFRGDIAEEGSLSRFASMVTSAFGSVDYLINNACLTRGGILSGCAYEDFLYVQRVGVAAPYALTKLLLPAFSSGASVVNICSTRAVMSQADTESYSAAKGGILALTHALAVSLSGRVRVNAVSPGWIDNTGSVKSPEDCLQHPAGRVGKPEDIARAVMFLCSGDAGFITGENITIDGGMTRLMIYSGDCGWSFSPPL